ncbi:PLDc N-terminal domain-containing protein [Carnobacterium divergens]|uniref:PLDc N-terminal domain-containing protein n=1 Tax=Carnobacterium divergens TaxID=2748 RepID=UPI00288FCC07|nr:PLDc N-terminal domain-containing protein [Carnobacterium divergens]MDT2010608.1 PLDc N-terminal domain-containing protein [Carnobacterium divergens]
MGDNWILFVPLIVIELGVTVTALIHVLTHDRYRFGNKGIWITIVLLFQLIGSIVYFVLGKEDNE